MPLNTSGYGGCQVEGGDAIKPETPVTGPDAPECSRDAVLHAPAQNDSLLVAHLPDPGAYTITAAPRKNTLLEGVAALISLTILFGAVWAGPWLTLAFLYALFVQRSTAAIVLLAALLAESLLPTSTVSACFRHSWLWDTWRRYFRLRMVTPPLPYLDPAKPVLFAHFPHATFPMGSWLSIPLCDSPETGLPAGTRAAVATVLLRLPLLRHVWGAMGCVPADYAPVRTLLASTSVGLVPEGVAGIFLGASKEHERIYARNRLGYIRLAMEAGADIVPVYSLGQSQMLDFWGSCALSRRMRGAVGVFWGRYGLPVPRPHDIIVTIGRPVPVKAKLKPSLEEVRAVQEAVLAALTAQFDRHKHLMPGWEAKQLEIV